MNTTEAIAFLARKGIKVVKEKDNDFRMWDMSGQPAKNYHRKLSWSWKEYREIDNHFTGRELISYARAYKDSRQQTTLHKAVKEQSNKRNRPATRDALKTEDFDRIPNQNYPLKEGDSWNFD